MNSRYVLSCCSTADLTKEQLQSRDIHYACMHFFLDGKEYLDDLGESMPFDKFYQAMADGADTKTSQINVDEFLSYFRPYLEQGKDVFHVSLSSGISGTFNAACVARDTLSAEFPDRKIWVVDSLCASSGYGLFMDALADLRDEGYTGEQLYSWAMENRMHLHCWFFSTDLTFYVKGGRISRASGLFGTVLNICPLMNMDDEGKLIPRHRLRGKNAAIREIVKMMREHAEEGTKYSGKCFISNSACPEDARAVADLVGKSFQHLKEEITVNSIGTTIGSHTGPGTVALFFWGDARVH